MESVIQQNYWGSPFDIQIEIAFVENCSEQSIYSIKQSSHDGA